MSDFNLSDKEFRFLSDTEFLPSKRKIIDKISHHFTSCSKDISEELHLEHYNIDERYLQWAPKISKGENYMGLPYVVLDNPRYFKSEEVLSYRIIFWWGNFFSFSLHLEGGFADEALNSVISKRKDYLDSGLYYCVGNNPWDYHFKESNYRSFQKVSENFIQNHYKRFGFLKIAKKATLSEWPFLRNLAIRNLQVLTKITNLARQS